MVLLFNEGEIIDDKYEVVVDGHIGNGGFGEVIKVKSTVDEIVYALKYCKSKSENDIKRFKREIRMMDKIDHENVIKIVDHNDEHNPPYFIMPLAITSGDKFKLETKSNIEATIQVFTSICKGIIAIHTNQLIHRDIKPANVLFFNNNGNTEIVVSDLGLSKFDERESTVLTEINVGGGSEEYAPPENYSGGKLADATIQGDVFMVALTLYAFYAGKDPTSGGIIERGLLPLRLERIILKATSSQPNERYQNVAKLLDSVNDFYSFTKHNEKKEKYANLIGKIKDMQELTIKEAEDAIYYLLELKDDDSFIELFNEIPIRGLTFMALLENDAFNSIVRLYCDKNNNMIGAQRFSYADIVGEKLEVIFYNVKSSDIKVLVLKSILITGNALNRFSVMNIFDNILMSIKDDDLGLEIAEMLKEENQYRFAFKRLEKRMLPSTIQSAWENANQINNFEDIDENIDFVNDILNN